MLHQARQTIVGAHGPDADAGPDDIVTALRQVRHELAHHFNQEEAGGCLEEAVSHCPTLSAESRRIEAEHPRLLARADQLIAEALDSHEPMAKRIAIEQGFEDLRRQLDAHEAAENAVLRKGFGVELNGTNNNHTLPLDV